MDRRRLLRALFVSVRTPRDKNIFFDFYAQKKNVARAMRDVSMLYRTPEATKLCIWTAKFVISFFAEFRRARERRERDVFVRDASSLCRKRNVACVCFQFHSFGIKKKLDRRHFSTARAS